MEWNTIPAELLERILTFTLSPTAIGRCTSVCCSWQSACEDQHLWKILYHTIFGDLNGGEFNWKKRVLDRFLIKKNVKDGKCVVRTLASGYQINGNATLEPDNCTLYKDHCLVGWMSVVSIGSYANVSPLNCHFIDLVTEETTEVDQQHLVFVNNLVCSTTSSYYGTASFSQVEATPFDLHAPLPTELSFDKETSVAFNLPNNYRHLIKNFDVDSKYCAFRENHDTTTDIHRVIDAENGEVVFEGFISALADCRLYDHWVAISFGSELRVIDVLTHTTTRRSFQGKFFAGFMTINNIVIRHDHVIIEWNYHDGTEIVHPAGNMPLEPITMIYSGMWLIYREAKLRFYNMTDGCLINTLALRQCSSTEVSTLSDGRLAVAQRMGCRVISFLNEEVNRRISVLVLDTQGTVKEVELHAHELADFFVRECSSPLEDMSSRLISTTGDTRYCLVFVQQTYRSTQRNSIASNLLPKAIAPTCLTIPYQGWAFRPTSVTAVECHVHSVMGSAILVCEKKIGRRWQMSSPDLWPDLA